MRRRRSRAPRAGACLGREGCIGVEWARREAGNKDAEAPAGAAAEGGDGDGDKARSATAAAEAMLAEEGLSRIFIVQEACGGAQRRRTGGRIGGGA